MVRGGSLNFNMGAHITVHDNAAEVSTYGGESHIDDLEMDDYGIQIGDISISGITGERMASLFCMMYDHLWLNGHRFKVVPTGEQDLKERMVEE